ncbi:MAG: tetratricopeptide repeat protein [Vicinamibacterales bacterium]
MELRRRIQADPASLAFAQLGEEYRRAGRYDEAVETCRAGLARHPEYLSARVTLGRALLEIGELEAAQEELAAVLRAAPENLAAIRGLAEIHQRRGELATALTFYRQALDLARHDRTLEQTVQSLDRQLGAGTPVVEAPVPTVPARAAAADAPPPSPPPAPVAPAATPSAADLDGFDFDELVAALAAESDPDLPAFDLTGGAPGDEGTTIDLDQLESDAAAGDDLAGLELLLRKSEPVPLRADDEGADGDRRPGDPGGAQAEADREALRLLEGWLAAIEAVRAE